MIRMSRQSVFLAQQTLAASHPGRIIVCRACHIALLAGKGDSPMPDVNLTSEEIEVLHEMLTGAQGDIQGEIHHTRTPEFKDNLRHRLEVYRALLVKLGDFVDTSGA
jgi:hypothetical protein